MVTIEWTISVGNILTMLIVSVAGLSAFFQVKSDVRLVGAALERFKARLDDFKDVLTKLVEQNQRIAFLEQTVQELRSGHGFKFDILEDILGRHRVPPNRKS